jgi:hypothetical protein
MVIDFPDGTVRREGELWRKKLTEAERRYTENQNHETLAEFKRTLKVFADLVLRNKMPIDE